MGNLQIPDSSSKYPLYDQDNNNIIYPTELIKEILKFLSPKDLCLNISRLNKLFNKLQEDNALWKANSYNSFESVRLSPKYETEHEVTNWKQEFKQLYMTGHWDSRNYTFIGLLNGKRTAAAMSSPSFVSWENAISEEKALLGWKSTWTIRIDKLNPADIQCLILGIAHVDFAGTSFDDLTGLGPSFYYNGCTYFKTGKVGIKYTTDDWNNDAAPPFQGVWHDNDIIAISLDLNTITEIPRFIVERNNSQECNIPLSVAMLNERFEFRLIASLSKDVVVSILSFNKRQSKSD